MGSPLTVTRDAHTAEDLRHIASNLKDARQVRRVQAISLVMDGWSRAGGGGVCVCGPAGVA